MTTMRGSPDGFIPLYEVIERTTFQTGTFQDLLDNLASLLPPPAPGLATERDWWLVWQKREQERLQQAKQGVLGGGEAPVLAPDAMQQWWRGQLPYARALANDLVEVAEQLREQVTRVAGLLQQQQDWQPQHVVQQQQEQQQQAIGGKAPE